MVGVALTVYYEMQIKVNLHCSNSHAKCMANSARNKPQYCSWPPFSIIEYFINKHFINKHSNLRIAKSQD